MKLILLFGVLALPLFSASAYAQQAQPTPFTPIPSTNVGTIHAATIGATNGILIAAPPTNVRRVYVRLANQSGTATVRCAWGATAAISADTAGQETLLPYAQMIWEGTFTPNDQLNCIATAGSTPFTYQVGP